MNQYLDSIIQRDPAARSRLNILINYPGVKAVAFYKLSHFLWNFNLYLLARMVSQFARFITGVEIHPAAKIGSGIMIDHAHNIVIGNNGVEKIIEVNFSEEEKMQFKKSIKAVQNLYEAARNIDKDL